MSTMAMTPELPDTHPDFIGPLARKLSKSSIGKSEDQSIPSPPLSPYHGASSSSSSAIDSTPRQAADLLRDLQLRHSDQTLESEPIETIVTLNNDKNELKEFPLNNYERFPLVVNAWTAIGTKSFKKSQLSFLKQYTNRTRGHRVDKMLPQRKYAPRRMVKVLHENYNSDSDYSSQFEKVRTRRVARETSQVPTDISDSSPVRNTASSTPTPRKRRPATPTVSHAHIDWESLPDYCPDLSTLPNNSRCLKVEWKGQPMSLAEDPLVGKLHPAEVTLASILRLPCNVYLDSKRRLFAEKVSRMKKDLPFRRTDAQKSCRIDVNKASRLFAAFEKIGWLEDHLFDKFM